ncbi:MAG: hypothetical protein JNK82_43495 [Myxococcaceae bacterium]|nr:hypothetical protein [Myxococcaceae bacterium]
MQELEDFFDAYARAFEAQDVPAITARWAYPCHVTSDLVDALSVVAVPSAEAFEGPVRQVLELYRRVGVKRVRLLSLDVDVLSGQLRRATVQWGLVGLADLPLYDFTTSYVLGRFEGQWRLVSAVAHDELRAYRRFLGR